MNNSKTWRPWEFPPSTDPRDTTSHDSQASSFCLNPGPENQDVGIRSQLAPSFGPIRTPRRSHTTAAKTSTNTLNQESSRMIPRDHSTGIHLGMTLMDAYYDPESRGVSRPPTRNPSRTGSRHNWMDRRSWRSRTDKANLSVDLIPIGDLQSMQSILINLSINNSCTVSATNDRLNASSTPIVSPTSTATPLASTCAISRLRRNRR